MNDFFTHKKIDRCKVFFLESNKSFVCKTLPTFGHFKHNISLEDNDGGVYKLVKTKGSFLAECFCNYGSYTKLKFDIIKGYEALNEENIVGNITFEAGVINFLIDNDNFCVKKHCQGYYSLKRNQNQIALIKTETLAEGDCNRYRVWYEPECENYFVYLLLCLSIMDYIFCTDNSRSGGRNQYHVYLKKSEAEEISWRPSDYTEIQREEDKKYFDKAEKDESKIRMLFILFMVVWVCLWVIIFLYEYI